MREKLKNNFSTKILSVVIAVIIWIIVSNMNDPIVTREISGIEVKFINEKVLDEINRAYDLEDSDTISVNVSGKRSIISKLRARDFKATADLSKLSIVDAVPLEVSLKNDIGQVTIDLGKNTMLKVKIDEVETATIPVNIDIEGEPADGYAVGKKTASPNMIEVTGPKTTIEKIDTIMLTCDVSGKSESVKEKVDVKFYTKEGKKISASKLKCSEKQISIKVDIWRQKEVPVSVNTKGNVADGYKLTSIDYEPKRVSIVGPDDELDEVTNVELQDIDVDGATSDVENNISLTDNLLPGNVIFEESNRDVAVKVKIGKPTEKKINFYPSDIQVLGQQDGKTVSFVESQYEMTISGLESDLDTVTLEDLEPHIQIHSLESGTHKVQIQLAENKNIDLVSIDNATVHILEKSTIG